MKNTPEELRAFAFGIMAGIAICVGTLFFFSFANDIRWEPVKIHRQ